MMNLPDYCYCATLPVEHTSQRLSWLQQQGMTLPESLNRAVLKRQCEFLTYWLCARKALLTAGFSEMNDIAIGDFREPLWPEGIVGAITHSNDKAAAVIIDSAANPAVNGVGIDIEPVMKEETARDLCKQILLPHEMAHHCSFSALSVYTTLVFSAKESLYKAIFPRCDKFLSSVVRRLQKSALSS